MKFSLIIAGLIAILFAFLATPRQQKIRNLAAEIAVLQASKQGLNPTGNRRIPSKPGHTRDAREEKVEAETDKLISFIRKRTALENKGKEDQIDDEVERIELVEMLSNLSPADLRLLTRIVCADTTLDQEEKFHTLGFASMNLARINPEVSLVIALEALPNLDAIDEANDSLLAWGLLAYSAKDPVAAAHWVVEHEEEIGGIKSGMKRNIIGSAARQDIGTAVGLIGTLKLSDDEHAFSTVARNVTSENADDFLAALRESDANPAQRENALGTLARSTLMRDFDAATTWLDKPGLTADERGEITNSLKYFAIKEEPEKWLDWLTSDEQHDNSETTENIIADWTRKDFVATGEWINDQEAGSHKNQSIQTYAETLAPHEPAAAADWAVTLPEGPERHSLLQSIHKSYQQKDPEAAATFAEKHGISAED